VVAAVVAVVVSYPFRGWWWWQCLLLLVTNVQCFIFFLLLSADAGRRPFCSGQMPQTALFVPHSRPHLDQSEAIPLRHSANVPVPDTGALLLQWRGWGGAGPKYARKENGRVKILNRARTASHTLAAAAILQ